MKQFKKTLIGCFAIISMSSQAELIENDWKALGDNAVTLDTISGLAWLDLTESGGQSYNQTMLELDTVFAGWRIPTETEVQTLYVNAFSNYDPQSSVTKIALYNDERVSWIDLFNGGTERYMGMFLRDNGTLAQTGVWSGYLYNTNHADIGADYHHSLYGTYLVSDEGVTYSSLNDPANNTDVPNVSVPLPASVGLLALAMLGFSARRK